MRKLPKDTAALLVIIAMSITVALYAADIIDSFHMSHAPEMSTCQ